MLLPYQRAAEAADRYGIPPHATVVVGSTYLESLATDTGVAAMDPGAVRRALQDKLGGGSGEGVTLAHDAPIIPLFLAPDDMVPDAAAAIVSTIRQLVDALAVASAATAADKTARPATQAAVPIIVVRPHPRWEAPTRDSVRSLVEEHSASQHSRASRGRAVPPPPVLFLDEGSTVG